jgi:small-conductance mechanosensitive channel
MNELITDNKLIASAALILISWLITWLSVRHIHNLPLGDDDRSRRWGNTIKNAASLLVVIGLIIIWLSELRFVALSIATFVVALVIATREFIQCVLGSFYLASTRAFSVGDWIKVGPHYGEVVSSDWLTTTLLEVDMESMSYAYTGKTLTIPNNQFVSASFQNLNFMRRYIAHSVVIVREADLVDLVQFKDLMLEKAREYCASFDDVAQRYHDLIQKRMGVDMIGSGPSVRLGTSNLGKNTLVVSYFCPTHEAVVIEQKLIADFMQAWYAELASQKTEETLREQRALDALC